MSCPAPLKNAGEIFGVDEDAIDLPEGYYLYTLLMIGTVIGLPLLYRQIWLASWATFRYYRRPPHLRGGPAGCRPIGKLGHRNLSTENRQKHQANGSSNGHISRSSTKVDALFVYPIKSCYPVELDVCQVTQMGFEYDRQFCFASWHEPSSIASSDKGNKPKPGSSAYWDSTRHWEFVTQRQTPSLTHLKVQIWIPDEELLDYDAESETVKSGGCLIVSFPFSPPMTSFWNICSILYAKLSTLNVSARPIWTFQVPLNPTSDQIDTYCYDTDKVRIWRDEPNGINMTSEIPNHILKHLQSLFMDDIKRNSPHKFARMKCPPELRLYRVDKTKDRNLYKCAPTKEQLGYQATVGYHDSYPLHILNVASIAEVEKHVPQGKAFTPDSRRYRANIYVQGPEAYDEDDWTYVSVGGHELHVSCRATRCKLPTNDPDKGVLGSDTQPYRYLTKNRAIDQGDPRSGCLGMMAVPTKSSIGVTIKVGDEIKVLRRGEHYFIADAEPDAQKPVL